MATPDPITADPITADEAIARLAVSAAAVHAAREALRQAEKACRHDVGTALVRVVEAGRNRSEVQHLAPFSAPTVRQIGEKYGLDPDQRYVRSVSGLPPNTAQALGPAPAGPQ